MNKVWYWVIIAVLVIVGIFSIRGCIKSKYPRDPEVIIRETRDTVVKIATFKVETPKLVYQKVIDSIPYPVFITDTVHIVKIPVTQSYYADSALYDIWISGFECKIDSLIVYPKTIEITNTFEIVTIQLPKRFGWGVYLGLGGQYGVIQRKFDFGPQIGIGCYINIQRRKK